MSYDEHAVRRAVEAATVDVPGTHSTPICGQVLHGLVDILRFPVGLGRCLSFLFCIISALRLQYCCIDSRFCYVSLSRSFRD